MLSHTRESTRVDRFGRTFRYTIFVLKCDTCGCLFERRGSLSRFASRKTHACSNECKSKSHKSGGVVERIRAKTNIENFGTENPFASEKCKEKMRSTWFEKYGVEHARSSDVVKQKVKETMLERYGVEHAGQSHEIQAKARATMLERHGVEYPMQMDSVKEAIEKSCIEKYGSPRILQSEIGRQRMKEALLEKYGVDHPQKSKEIQEKTKQTCLARYGADNISKSDYFANMPFSIGCHKSGYVNFKGRDVWFRSSYEERFLKWLTTKDNVLDLKCNISTVYIFEGKEHKYFIDFGVEYTDYRKILYEVKNEYAKQSAKNIAKFEAARLNLINLGYDSFEIITEKTLENIGA